MIKNLLVLLCCFLCGTCCCQVTLKGKVRDAANGEPVFSANVIVKGSTTGVTTDFDGEFTLQVQSLPVTLVASFIGYNPKEVNVSSADSRIEIKLGTSEILIDEAEIVGERISEKQKAVY
ncbi:MAG: carboxypeptidase-like regulatory domain-containing protein [Flavobacteriales bacterium]